MAQMSNQDPESIMFNWSGLSRVLVLETARRTRRLSSFWTPQTPDTRRTYMWIFVVFLALQTEEKLLKPFVTRTPGGCERERQWSNKTNEVEKYHMSELTGWRHFLCKTHTCFFCFLHPGHAWRLLLNPLKLQQKFQGESNFSKQASLKLELLDSSTLCSAHRRELSPPHVFIFCLVHQDIM